MSFGLKNVGATYPRAMMTLFHDIMHKEIKVYVDDVIAKSREGENHVQILKELLKYKLRLNHTRCSFRVKSGKLLGFMMSDKGIEVDPKKLNAIQSMPTPKTKKDIRGFLGRLNYITPIHIPINRAL